MGSATAYGGTVMYEPIDIRKLMQLLAGLATQQVGFSTTLSEAMKAVRAVQLPSQTQKLLAGLATQQVGFSTTLSEAMKAARAVQSPSQTQKLLATLAAQQVGFSTTFSEAMRAVLAVPSPSQTTRMLAGLAAQQAKFGKLFATAGLRDSVAAQAAPLLTASAATWFKAANTNLSAVQSLSQRVHLSALPSAIMQPLWAYSSFSTRTIRRLAELDRGTVAARSLARSIDWAQVEITEVSARVPALAGLVTGGDANDEPFAQGILNLLLVGGREIAAAAGSGGVLDIGGIRTGSRAARVAERGQKLLDLLLACNGAAIVSLRDRIFGYTERTLGALIRLPFIVPMSIEPLGDVVDALYFALYEGAGKPKLRFMRPKGPLTKDESQCVFHLKSLRDTWLRHDPQQASEDVVRRSSADLKKALAYFGLDHVPTKPSEFRSLHEAIVKKTEAFLETLLRRLQES
jgi:hypothetical protein